MSHKLLLSILFPLVVGCHIQTQKDTPQNVSKQNLADSFSNTSAYKPPIDVIDPMDDFNWYITLEKPIMLDEWEGCATIEYDISKEGTIIAFSVAEFMLRNDSSNLRINYDGNSRYTQQDQRLLDSIKSVLQNQVRNYKVQQHDSLTSDYPTSVKMVYKVYNRKKVDI